MVTTVLVYIFFMRIRRHGNHCTYVARTIEGSEGYRMVS